MRHCIALVALVLGGATVFACGHSSTQEATTDCQNLAKTNPEITGTVFNACVACFENCSDCEQKGTSPVTFKCPGDNSGGGAGGTGSSSSSTGTGK